MVQEPVLKVQRQGQKGAQGGAMGCPDGSSRVQGGRGASGGSRGEPEAQPGRPWRVEQQGGLSSSWFRVPVSSWPSSGLSLGLLVDQSQGASINSGSACTTQCASGYTPSTASLSCSDGTLTPGTFTCPANCAAPTVTRLRIFWNEQQKQLRFSES